MKTMLLMLFVSFNFMSLVQAADGVAGESDAAYEACRQSIQVRVNAYLGISVEDVTSSTQLQKMDNDMVKAILESHRCKSLQMEARKYLCFSYLQATGQYNEGASHPLCDSVTLGR